MVSKNKGLMEQDLGRELPISFVFRLEDLEEEYDMLVV
jgi:hypothetical protein